MKDLSWDEIERGHQWNGDWNKGGTEYERN